MLEEKLRTALKNWAIDTSAYTLFYYPTVACVQLACGIKLNQVLKDRATAALVDVLLSRVAGKTLDYTRRNFNPNNTELRGYFVDTLTGMGVFVPVRVASLALYGVEAEKIAYSVGINIAINFVTGRPFSKFVLDNWRKYWHYSK